ncbi:BON domain-containing protein [Aquincola sp. S2]|uniref:BON domain-containing protein n=1 Tax=Pseudaquabacterium terrae TaxID=2732868 RepID=A0ABX2EL49_9BURK|nr:BON domain-containing protein [Aquabacterium terrae]NRF69387.1 BON domain-containing protein [Aquabacterium terrae]
MKQLFASVSRCAAVVALAAITTPLFSGCAPLMVGGAVVGGLMASDRRTSGAQVEDQSIELKAVSRVKTAIGDRGHVNVTSYNRMVLITGEVASDADRAAVEQALGQIENVRSVVNELAVTAASSIGSRSNDVVLTSKVKASLIDARDLHANAFKVVTERGQVFLLGRVTEREANRATEVARSIGGVQKVVRVFELISEAELASGQPPKQQ